MTFSPSQFTPTQWDTAADKVLFAEQFVQFVQSDFNFRHFTDKFYRRLSNTFGHIAHYNRGGFWDTFFRTTHDKVRFLEWTLQHPCYGDPTWTYSDVERALQAWLKTEDMLNRYLTRLIEENEAAERVELARLLKKYAPEVNV
jgi:hypothetical protein